GQMRTSPSPLCCVKPCDSRSREMTHGTSWSVSIWKTMCTANGSSARYIKWVGTAIRPDAVTSCMYSIWSMTQLVIAHPAPQYPGRRVLNSVPQLEPDAIGVGSGISTDRREGL